jgi:hypothetical protein
VAYIRDRADAPEEQIGVEAAAVGDHSGAFPQHWLDLGDAAPARLTE